VCWDSGKETIFQERTEDAEEPIKDAEEESTAGHSDLTAFRSDPRCT